MQVLKTRFTLVPACVEARLKKIQDIAKLEVLLIQAVKVCEQDLCNFAKEEEPQVANPNPEDQKGGSSGDWQQGQFPFEPPKGAQRLHPSVKPSQDQPKKLKTENPGRSWEKTQGKAKLGTPKTIVPQTKLGFSFSPTNLNPTPIQNIVKNQPKSQTPSQQASKNQPKSQTPGELVAKTAEKNSALQSKKTQTPPSQKKIKKKICETLEKTVAGNVWPLYIAEKNKRYRLQQAKLQPSGMVFLQIKERKTKIGKSDAERWIATLQAAKKAKKLKKTASLYFSRSGFTKGALAIFAENQVHAIAA